MTPFISLSDLALKLNVNRQRLLRQLKVIDAAVHGMALHQAPATHGKRQGGKVWVNEAAISLLAIADLSRPFSIEERLAELEAHTKSLDVRLSDVETMVA